MSRPPACAPALRLTDAHGPGLRQTDAHGPGQRGRPARVLHSFTPSPAGRRTSADRRSARASHFRVRDQWERSQILGVRCDWLRARGAEAAGGGPRARAREVAWEAAAAARGTGGQPGEAASGGARPGSAAKGAARDCSVPRRGSARASLRRAEDERARTGAGPGPRPPHGEWMCPARGPGGRRRPPRSCARPACPVGAGSCPPRCCAPTASSPASGRPSPS